MRDISKVAELNISKLLSDNNKQKITMSNLVGLFNSSLKTKYTPEEYLNYLIIIVIETFKGKRKFSSNQLSKVLAFIGAIADTFDKKGQKIDTTIVSKAALLPNLYKEYCEREQIEFNNHLSDLISAMFELIKGCSEAEINEENTNKILELEGQLKVLKKENDTLLKKVETLENKVEHNSAKSTKSIQDREEKIKELQRQIRMLNNEAKRSEKEKLGLTDKIYTLKDAVESLKQEIANDESTIEKMLKENDELKNRILGLETANRQEKAKVASLKSTEEYSLGSEIINNNLLDNFVLQLLLKEQLTINEIMDRLNNAQFNVNMYEVQQSLKRIKNRVNIENPRFITGTPGYTVQAPSVITDKILTIPAPEGDCLDLLFTSDIHFKNGVDQYNKNAVNRIYDLYDYCIANGIENIINLGDVIEEQNEEEVKYARTIEDLESRESFLAELSMKSFPTEILGDISSSNIKQFILGGNHDYDFSRLWGIDPIEALKEYNPNIINMGYNDATIRFGNNDFIGVHHKGVPREDKVGSYESINSVIEYIRKYCSRNGLLYSNDYLDLFGHIHRGKVDTSHGFAVVPSMMKDRSCSGAYHLKVYFDSNKNINYIYIYPLVFEFQDVKQANEIVYQRNRTK